MTGNNSGVLSNAYPLDAERIRELEITVLENGGTFAYLNEQSELCFAMPSNIESIKDLAWDNAYELYADQDTFFKKCYIKTGLKTYEQTGLFSKEAYMDSWQDVNAEPEVDPATYLTVASTVNGRVSVKATPDADIPATVFIPETLNSYPVYQVHSAAFLDNTAVQKVIISDSVEYLQSRAFNGCSNLREVSLGTGLAFIAAAAFGNCANLTNVTFRGTTADWKFITKNTAWNSGSVFEYVQCTDGRVYLDGTVTLEGDGQEFYTAAPAMLSFRSQEPIDEFQKVLVNGEVVDPSNYELEEGSTIVKLSTEYLKTLPVGDYGIEVVSKNAAPAGTFAVMAPDLNEYGFYYDQPYSTPYDEETMDASAFVLRRDGTVDIFAPNVLEVVATSTYICDSGIVTIGTGDEMLPLQIVNSGKTLAIEGIEFSICGGDWMYADAEYFYHKTFDDDNNAYYLVKPVDKTKTTYSPTAPNVNAIPVALIQTYMNTNVIDVTIAEGIRDAKMVCFQCSALETVTVPASVTNLRFAFSSCDNLKVVEYGGTAEQWETVSAGSNIKAGVRVYCSDDIVITE